MTDWPGYVEWFHGNRPGVTEAVLSRCVDEGGASPYEWLTAPITGVASVVDVGCGSAPTRAAFGGWIGVDVSSAELKRAGDLGRGPLVRGRAEALPVAGGVVDAVVAAMSFMVVDHPAGAVAEAVRLLKPGGRLALLVPANGPLTLGDKARYAALLAALGRSEMPFPHPELNNSLRALLVASGVDVVSDEQRRFGLRFVEPETADLFVSSLYAPGVSVGRARAARRIVRSWRRGDLGVPLRRVIGVRRR